MSETTIRDAIAAAHPELTAIRRDIHAHPEIGMEEFRTAALVASKLREWGLEVTEGVGKVGVVGTVRGKLPGQRSIGLRADMDALTIPEQTGLDYASTNAGLMHACGHDGHTAMLLGAAKILSANRDFSGTVHLIFQPAEEGRGGAVAMIDDGLFERFPCDAVYGMHNMPGIAVGKFGLRNGPMMAGSGRWAVTFRGTGGHGGATPHLATDVTIAQAQFVLSLQTIVSRSVPPAETAVISIGSVHGGSREASNVMPAEMEIVGTMRCFSPKIQDLIAARIEILAQAAAAATGCTAEVNVRWITHVLVNHADQTDVALTAARALVGAVNVKPNITPITGGEDFAFMLEKCPGAFILIGNGVGTSGRAHMVHTPQYNFNDDIIPLGVEYWIELVRQELSLAA